MSITHHRYDFWKRINELRAEKKAIDDKIEQECEKVMNKYRVPKVGTVYHDIPSGVTIKITDRRINPTPSSRNWSMTTCGVMLNGNPVDKRGMLDHSTRTGIHYEFDII